VAVQYSDDQIAALVDETKRLPGNWSAKTQLRSKPGHDEGHFLVTGDSSNQFRIILRRSNHNSLDFSVILAVQIPQSNRLFRLRRYNGKSHEHTNVIERDKFYDYHVHMATERYQAIGAREDAYAEPTNRYGDYRTALNMMLSDNGFVLPTNNQMAFPLERG